MENDLNLLNSIYKNTLSSIKADENQIAESFGTEVKTFNRMITYVLLKAFPVIVTQAYRYLRALHLTGYLIYLL